MRELREQAFVSPTAVCSGHLLPLPGGTTARTTGTVSVPPASLFHSLGPASTVEAITLKCTYIHTMGFALKQWLLFGQNSDLVSPSLILNVFLKTNCKGAKGETQA